MSSSRPQLPPAPYLVVGLARSGVAVAEALASRGAAVIGCDAAESLAAGRLRDAGVEVHLKTDGSELISRAKTVVKSPGVPHEAAVVQTALAAGMAVVGELEIAWRMLPNEFLAVTGTNGKTTTTELLGHIYRKAGLPVAVAGNVGTAVSSLIDRIDSNATVVCEASSFQLEDSELFAPEGALLLNIAEDHLDRHHTLSAYREAKLKIFSNQQSGDVAVLPSELEALAVGGGARRLTFGSDSSSDLRYSDGALWWQGEQLLSTNRIRIRGPHNRENAMAAATLALARGVAPDAVRRALESFPGVPHRLEEIACKRGVTYINDSKATNVASTVVAIKSFSGGVHLILGGQGKGSGFSELTELVAERCKAVYAIGESAERISTDLHDSGVSVSQVGDLERAVASATESAVEGDTVLLSPACASFDQYRNFEQRGEHFKILVAGVGSDGNG